MIPNLQLMITIMICTIKTWRFAGMTLSMAKPIRYWAYALIDMLCCETFFAKCEEKKTKYKGTRRAWLCSNPTVPLGRTRGKKCYYLFLTNPALNFDRKAFRNRSSSTSTPTWLPSRGTTTPTPTMGRWPCGRWGESWSTLRWTDE